MKMIEINMNAISTLFFDNNLKQNLVENFLISIFFRVLLVDTF